MANKTIGTGKLAVLMIESLDILSEFEQRIITLNWKKEKLKEELKSLAPENLKKFLSETGIIERMLSEYQADFEYEGRGASDFGLGKNITAAKASVSALKAAWKNVVAVSIFESAQDGGYIIEFAVA